MPSIITLQCPSCGGKIAVDSDTRRYVCDYCGNEHIIFQPDEPEYTLHPKPSYGAQKPAARPRVPRPEGLIVERDQQTVRLVRRWFSLKYVPLAFFCVAWDAFLLFWYGIAFNTNAPWIMFVFPMVHLAVGVGLTYSTLAGFLNETELAITPKSLTIWNGPLPWIGNLEMPLSELAQLYVTEKHSGKNGSTHSYDLYAIDHNNQRRKLMADLDQPEVGLYIEQQLESWLKIADQPVAGELPRWG